MRSHGFASWAILMGLGLAIMLVDVQSVHAQANNGVIIDATGVLKVQSYADPGNVLLRQRMEAARVSLAPEVMKPSPMRCISLNRLEEAIVARGGVPTEVMRNLAGLIRIKYVFYYPETKDIVVAGPAEGWVDTPAGRLVGMKTGRPIVQLQDLVTAMRAYSPSGKKVHMIGCSIDPSPEGLAEMQRFMQTLRPVPTQAFANYVVQGLKTSLGLQNVRVDGISAATHFAQVMVEADYRMKLIGIGMEQPPVAIPSYVARANPSDVARNAMQRWYFVPDYKCVRVTADLTAMALEGDGVKLIGENELVGADGQRRANSKGNRASDMFVNTFTKKYNELAERSPIYAELRNMVDASIVAAYMQKARLYEKAGWSMEFLGDESKYQIENYSVPKTVETACTAIWKSGRLMTPVGGGVEIKATKALDSENLMLDDRGLVAKTREETKLNLAAGQWWWDQK